MKAEMLNFVGLMSDQSCYQIPIFQRYYAWKKEDWQRLWDDILNSLEADERTASERTHFMGTIVAATEIHAPSKMSEYDVIDGQQRLTTLSILCCAMRDMAAEGELKSEIKDISAYRHPKKAKHKIVLRQRDREHYKNLVDAGEADGDIGRAHAFFKKQIEEFIAEKDGDAELRKLFEFVSTGMVFAFIVLDKKENPYKIFKSLNSTGQDLSESDLVRNYVFSAVSDDKQEEFDESKWRPLEEQFKSAKEKEKFDGGKFSDFLRCAIMRAGIRVRPNAVSSTFEQQYAALNPDKIVDELRPLSRHYTDIIGDTECTDGKITESLRHIRGLYTSAANPLLMRLLELHAARELDKLALVRCVQNVASFIFRRYICGESSRAYANWFCAVCKDVGAEAEKNLCVFLGEKGWPTDSEFKEKFVANKIYNGDYCRFALDAIELSKQRPSEPVALDNCQTEHIMPQTLSNKWKKVLGNDWEAVHEEWLHTPGNLTLVGADYNKEMSNRPYEDKKDYLRKSKVYLNSRFHKIDKWTSAEIKKRGAALAADAVKIWPGPDAA